MSVILHKTYPHEIKNPHKVIIAVKLLPCGLPKEGPKPATFSVPYAVVYASSLWDNEGVDVAHWDWWQCTDPETREWLDHYIKNSDLAPNVWYYLDIFDEGE